MTTVRNNRSLPKGLLLALAMSCLPLVELGCDQTSTSASGRGETVYERVVDAGKLRAAYITYPPACIKDTTTGELSGIFVDVLERAAHNLGLELEWTEEVGWGSQIEGLETDRYDIVGSPVWANPTRGKLTTLSIPVYYSGIGIYVRHDDDRFIDDFSSINSSGVRIATIDGETADLIARAQFPNAQRVSLPQLADISQMFLNIATNKADVVFAEPYYGYKYMKNNPGTVKNIAAESPIRLFGNCYMIKKNEMQLKHMLDVAIQDLLNSGYVDEVIDNYEPVDGLFYRAARPFRPLDGS